MYGCCTSLHSVMEFVLLILHICNLVSVKIIAYDFLGNIARLVNAILLSSDNNQ